SLICLANAISSFLSSGSKEIIFTGLLVCPVFWEKSNFNRKLIYEKYITLSARRERLFIFGI
ncbi:MAG TPA: hypothetical protein VMR41_04360, partial [Patescibacteria group bacterium]|nr:hypothetical protein [Patescibacteria group bacterium]